MNPILLTDYYKVNHWEMYPKGTTMIYSNLTARKSRMEGVDSIVFFGLQHFVHKYLQGKFQTDFFKRKWEDVEEEYKFAINTPTDHIKALHELGYLPIQIKAVPEGTRVPIRVPCMTIRNTKPEFFWLTNYLETLLSCQLWQPITSATIAAEYWKILSKYAKETTNSTDGVQWQGHDFSMRGMSSVESAILSGMGHLTSFTGTDCIPAIYALRNSYKGEGLIGGSVPATEHSVMCMGTKDDEVGTFSKLLDLYPTGILSVVSDTWDLWKVLTEYLPTLKEKILGRDGKLVIRPDSGDPVDIICGKQGSLPYKDWDDLLEVAKGMKGKPAISLSEYKGVVELLWDTFGGTIVKGADGKDYKLLDSHIGAIYGDSITLERAEEICKRLKAKGFASTNIVLGIGSYTYQMNTRDTFGFAVKATFGELITLQPACCGVYDDDGEGDPVCCGHPVPEQCLEPREIWKDPITDDGTKKSLKGLIRVERNVLGDLVAFDQQTWAQEETGMLETVYLDGKIIKSHTLAEIRQRIKSEI